MKTLLTLALVFFVSSTNVWADDSNFTNSDLFVRLIQLATKNTESERQGAKGDYIRYLAHVLPNDVTQARTADYFTVRGYKDDAKGEFLTTEINLIAEIFTQDADKNWVIDQWIFTLNQKGEIREFSHKKMIRTPESIVSDIVYFEETPETVVKVVTEKLEQWFSRLPTLQIKTGCSVPSPQCIEI